MSFSPRLYILSDLHLLLGQSNLEFIPDLIASNMKPSYKMKLTLRFHSVAQWAGLRIRNLKKEFFFNDIQHDIFHARLIIVLSTL